MRRLSDVVGSAKYDCLFWSCDHVVVARVIPTTKKGVPHYTLVMFPTDELMLKYPDIVNEKTLDYGLMEDGLGVFEKTYPAEYVIKRLENPESPWLIVLCDFDGSLNIRHDLQLKAFENKNLQSLNNSLLTENERLREELKDARNYEFELRGVGDVQHI